MEIQFNSDNRTDGDTAVADRVSALVEGRLSRVADRLTRVEVHVGDVNGPRGGANDKRCTIEARPAGMGPVSATAHHSSIDAAAASAADKVVAAIERQIGKTTTRKGH